MKKGRMFYENGCSNCTNSERVCIPLYLDQNVHKTCLNDTNNSITLIEIVGTVGAVGSPSPGPANLDPNFKDTKS